MCTLATPSAGLYSQPCTTGAQVILWKLTGSGHVWPGSSKHLERLLGKPNNLFDASEEIWRFFSRTKPR